MSEEKLEAVKNDLVEWSRHHDPPEGEKQIHLWCSINRLIGDHFGTDWMDEDYQTSKPSASTESTEGTE